MEVPTARIDALLRKAIEQRRLIRFNYKDKPRIVEPHDYGVHKGSVKLFGYQVGGLNRACLGCPSWVHSTNSTSATSTGCTQTRSFIFSVVSPSPHRPPRASGRFANGHSAISSGHGR
jgi:hypothetical protein